MKVKFPVYDITSPLGRKGAAMEHLKAIHDLLCEKKNRQYEDFYIPEAWNTWGFAKFRTDSSRPGEILVNPFDFFSESIAFILKAGANNNPIREDEHHNPDALNAIRESRICKDQEFHPIQEDEKYRMHAVNTIYAREQYGAYGLSTIHVDEQCRAYERSTTYVDEQRRALEPHPAHAGEQHTTHELNPSRHSMYCMLIGMITAWDHYQKDQICPGTFMKTICLLPRLKSYGIDVISLLPVFERSDRYKKGKNGSPYAIKNILKIDNSLHEPLLGSFSEELLELELKAFVEACHGMGMKVMMDFAFRTAARDSDLILDHPDWFYWIKLKYAKTIAVPAIDGYTKPLQVNDKTLPALYASKGVKEYLSSFVPNPRETDVQKWEVLIRRQKETGENILDLIENECGITTLPAFSDVLNDTQPKWTDVTYLRYYFHPNEKAAAYIDVHQPPYIMQDGVKLNLYPGRGANKQLFQYICDVIPYYQERFGIDGARLDMGHALPTDLNREIIDRAISRNKGFLFWSEEFEPEKSRISKQNGFHFITGKVWSIYRDLEKKSFNRRLLKEYLLKSELPVAAALETPDTPRAAWLWQNKRKLEQLVLLNCFLPNTIPFWNSGFDVLELQPMNLGLDNTEDGRFVLEPDDPMYGRLAFFDPYRLHWASTEQVWVQNLLKTAARLRQRFISLISRRECFVEIPKLYNSTKLIFLYYSSGRHGNDVFFLANRNFREKAVFTPSEWFPEEARGKKARIIYRNGLLQNCENVLGTGATQRFFTQNDAFMTVKSMLLPGEVIIGEVIYGEKE